MPPRPSVGDVQRERRGFFIFNKMNELQNKQTLETSKANGAASIVEARKRNRNRIRKPESEAQASRLMLADPRTAYLGVGVRYAKTWVSYWDFKEFLEGFEAYGHRLFDACVQNNDKELLAEYSMCLAELSAARSLALVKMLDELGDKDKMWRGRGDGLRVLFLRQLVLQPPGRCRQRGRRRRGTGLCLGRGKPRTGRPAAQPKALPYPRANGRAQGRRTGTRIPILTSPAFHAKPPGLPGGFLFVPMPGVSR